MCQAFKFHVVGALKADIILVIHACALANGEIREGLRIIDEEFYGCLILFRSRERERERGGRKSGEG